MLKFNPWVQTPAVNVQIQLIRWQLCQLICRTKKVA